MVIFGDRTTTITNTKKQVAQKNTSTKSLRTTRNTKTTMDNGKLYQRTQ